jgi:hypothetical protein
MRRRKGNCLILVLLTATVLAQSNRTQSWRSVQPLHTSRAEVERRLGLGKIIGGVSTYEFEDETVEIFYSQRSCLLDAQGWDVPKGVSLEVIPKRNIAVSEMGMDLRKFRKKSGARDLPFHSLLVDDEDGIVISAMNDVVESYSYIPKASEATKRCPGYSDAEEQRLKDCIPDTLFTLECSSEQIDRNSVTCRAKFLLAPRDFAPTIRWSVSKNASFQASNEDIVVRMRHHRSRLVDVRGEVTSPESLYESCCYAASGS